MLDYALVQSKFGEGFSAITYLAGKSLTQYMLINRIMEHCTMAADGEAINLPLINTSFSISGVFDSPMDAFDGNRHKLNLNITKGVLLREAEKKVKLQKTITVLWVGHTALLWTVRRFFSKCKMNLKMEKLNSSSAMETRDHFKNGAISKSHTKRRSQKVIVFLMINRVVSYIYDLAATE